MSSHTSPSTAALLARTALFTLAIPGSVVGLVPWWLAHGRLGSAHFEWPVARPLSLALAALGLPLYLACALEFARRGRGTPFPLAAPRRLVVAGLYRHTRNPMYWAMGALLCAHALWSGRWIALAWLACVCAAWHAFVRWHEEPELARRFGASYAHYCARVPRWRWRWRAYEPGA